MKDNVGILSTGVYIPDNYMDSSEIAEKTDIPEDVIREKFGITKKPIPGKEDHTCEMGIKASNTAIQKAGIDPEDIDLVIWAGAEHKEYPMWTASIKLQHEIGAYNAWAFDIALRCGTMIMAMKVAKDMMLNNENMDTVLIGSGYRNGDLIDFDNPKVSFMYNLGAGGTAVILKKGLGKNSILEATARTDGSLSESVVVPAGGTKKELTAEGLENNEHHLDVLEPEFMKERLNEVSIDNFVGVVKDSVKRSGYEMDDVDYIAILHMKYSAHKFMLDQLGLTEEQSIYLDEYGHIGQNDQIISLELALDQGKVKPGDIVVFVSAGIGYAWNALTIEWG
ncbi:MAG TPA: 3-oxoacyl-ACP synthase [Halanaerobiales bacterium]|nr:3-oxoacyl-ACP synthase [Halanaerobiales bacterium]